MTTETKSPIPRKLDEGVIAALCEYVRKGNYAHQACYLCGIDQSTLWRWTQLGEADIEAGHDTLYSRLCIALKKARAEAQKEMVEVARNAAKANKDGYLAITFMERTDPENWGRRDRIQGGNTYNINIEKALIDAGGKLSEGLDKLAGRVDNVPQITEAVESDKTD